MAWKGKFRPLNPGKYRGKDLNNIIYRSSLELRFMRYCDTSSRVVWWSSEEVVVPYYDPVKKKQRRYFPDFVLCRLTPEGEEEKIMVEIKMARESLPPTHYKGKRKARVISEELTWRTNQAKWAAARLFCNKYNLRFELVDEKVVARL